MNWFADGFDGGMGSSCRMEGAHGQRLKAVRSLTGRTR